MQIGVISDTHGLLREEVKEQLRGCDVILHGGDIHRESVLEELRKTAPVYAVRGNADGSWAEGLPLLLSLEISGIRVRMVHNRKDLPENLEDTDLVVYGHSHKYEDRVLEGVRWLNPGSCGPRRFHLPVTMAVVETDAAGIRGIRRVELCGGLAGGAVKLPEGAQDRRRLIEGVMRDVDRGRTVEQTARRNHIGQELAEQICRMYLTHPGVDVDGILDRITRL